MKYGSVCSGIEAATAAWHSLGWQPAFFSEIEPFPRAVLAHHYPTVPLHGDFTTIGADQYGAIDLLVGGTPCQSFSVAGLRGGLDDDRGNLALEFLRLADRKRPRWVVWENVPGVLSSNGGRDFGSILGGLGELGYGWAYRVLDAQYFGVAQRRRRVFVVGYLGDWRPAAAVLFERHSLSGHPAPRRETGQGVAKDAIGRTASGRDTFGTLTAKQGEKQWLGNQEALSGDYHVMAPTISPCLETQKGGLRGPDTQAYVEGALPASLGKGLGHNKDDFCVALGGNQGGDFIVTPFDTTQISSPHNYSNPQAGDPCHPLAAGAHAPAIAFAQNTRDEVRLIGGDGEIAGALAAQPGMKQTTYIAFSSNMSVPDCQTDGTTPTLKLGGHGGGNPPAVAFALRGREDGAMPEVHNNGDTAGALRAANGGSSRDYVAFGETARTLSAQYDGSPCADRGPDVVTVAFEANMSLQTPSTNGVNPTLTRRTHASVAIQSAVRRLTPVECERLQGFPDNFTAIPWRKKGAEDCPDGPRYKALGNSMAVPVMRWIGERIAAVEAFNAP